MQLTPGSRLGIYEVIAPIGAGGIGEVYRAHDTVLGRDVAIKVLSREASGDPDRQQRFEREARAVAALSHPNILSIYSFGNDRGVAFAVMELLEGRTLREELANGALTVRRSIEFGSQIALGLAAAHERGISHRDLKPENVFVTPDGRIKLLDFGLALIVKDPYDGETIDSSQSDAFAGPGLLLGSLGYMSPEQVSGTAIDHRTDLFSLGIVLFEMLTGQAAFQRTTAVETLTATLKDAPPAITMLRSGVPIPLEYIVLRCLEKSPTERFQSARDLAFALSALATPADEPILPGKRRAWGRLLTAAGAAVLVATGVGVVAGARYRGGVAAPHPLITFTIPPPSGTTLANVPEKMLAISPNGDRIVFAVERGGQRELWVRSLAATTAEPLPGTAGAGEPFWSADGQHIGFFADGKLKRVGADGSMLIVVCDAPADARGGSWNSEGTILFSDAFGGLSRVVATGGVPMRVTTPDMKAKDETDGWPQFLPDGRRFLYLHQKGASAETGAAVFLSSIDGGPGRQLLTNVFNASFVAPDLLVFADQSTVKVQRIDLDHGRMSGEIEDVTADVDRHLNRAALTVSASGTLAYAAAGSRNHRLAWFDRKGHELGIGAPPDAWRDIVLSPDGTHAAVQRIVSGANDIWTIDLLRGVPSRFTFTPDVDDDPVWSPDGKKIAFSSVRDGVLGIYEKALSGGKEAELLFANHAVLRPTAWSPDGRALLFDQKDPANGADIWVLPLEGPRVPRRYLSSEFSESDAHFAPDGKWVAYESDESGQTEIYVQSYPDLRQKIQISTGGGNMARWARGGRELFFLSTDRRLMVVNVTPGDHLEIGPPTALFETSVGLGTNRYAPASDGERFLMSIGTPESGAAPLVVLVNWADQLTGHQLTHRVP